MTIEAIRELLDDPSWVEQAFTTEELAAVASRRDAAPGLAARLAAKRAVLVAIHGASRPPLEAESPSELRSVEVLTGDDGSPAVRVGPAPERGARPFVIHVSLSHDGGLAVALVVVEATPTAVTPPEGSDDTE